MRKRETRRKKNPWKYLSIRSPTEMDYIILGAYKKLVHPKWNDEMKETLLQSPPFECFILFENSPRVPVRACVFPFCRYLFGRKCVDFHFYLGRQSVSWKQWRKWNDCLIFRPYSLQTFRAVRERNEILRSSTLWPAVRLSHHKAPSHTRMLTVCVSKSQWYYSEFQRGILTRQCRKTTTITFFFLFPTKKNSFLLAKCSIRNYSNNFVRLRLNGRMKKWNKNKKERKGRKGKEKLLTNKVWRTGFFLLFAILKSKRVKKKYP